jgi:hypothetical protein
MEALARAGRRVAALAQYERCRNLLWVELGLEPTVTTVDLAASIQKGNLEPHRDPPPRTKRGNPYIVPSPSTPLIGRDAERAAVGALLAGTARLVSVVAPGGMGKTRLALAVTREQVQHFADGVAFVDLGAVSGPNGIVPAIVRCLRLDIDERGATTPKVRCSTSCGRETCSWSWIALNIYLPRSRC